MAGEERSEDNEIALAGDERLTIREMFDIHFPYYLIYGMTYEQFWEQDVELAVYYRKAYELRKKIEFEEQNQTAWLQGLYYMRAIEVSTEVITKSFSGKKGGKTIKSKYPEKPFDFNKKEKPVDKEQEQENLVKFLKAFEMKHKSSKK